MRSILWRVNRDSGKYILGGAGVQGSVIVGVVDGVDYKWDVDIKTHRTDTVTRMYLALMYLLRLVLEHECLLHTKKNDKTAGSVPCNHAKGGPLGTIPQDHRLFPEASGQHF
jgi:hypothetical protein